MNAPHRGRRAPSVVLVAHQYWPTPGGATQVMSALVRALREGGASVTVLTAGRRQEPETIVGPHGESVVFVMGPERSGSGILRILDLMRFAVGVTRKGRHLHADVVVSDAPPTAANAALRLARRQKSRFVYYFSDSWSAATKDATSLLARVGNRPIGLLENSTLKRADLVVAVTRELRSMASDAGSQRVMLVENGISTNDFSAMGEEWRPTSSDKPFFLYAGNAGVVHGAEVFASAARVLWDEGLDFDLVFMGYGVGLEAVSGLGQSWPGRVHVLGNQDVPTVAAAYRGAVGALSSLRPMPMYAHARPMKTMSGISCGCPAVYVGSGAFADELAANDLGIVRPWSVPGAVEAMRLTLIASRSDAEYLRAQRDRLRTYAVQFLDESHGATRVARAIETMEEVQM